MSKPDRKADAPSTVEAIRMASASVIGTTTNLGYPLGSAVGAGSMMEENSDTGVLSCCPWNGILSAGQVQESFRSS